MIMMICKKSFIARSSPILSMFPMSMFAILVNVATVTLLLYLGHGVPFSDAGESGTSAR